LAENGQAPSTFSHNVYIQDDTTDVTFRDNITLRSASFGAHLRGGAFVEDNVFLDNNAAVDTLGGDRHDAGAVGNYTLFADNLVTSGAHKTVDQFNGAITQGIDNQAQDTTLTGNIVAHLSDPNNPVEFTEKYWWHDALINGNDPFYDDTIIYNWIGSRSLEFNVDKTDEANTQGLDTDVLDQTTIQIFAAELLGDPDATISDLATYLRENDLSDTTGVSDADVIIDFFQEGFEIASSDRDAATTVRFVPNELGDGIRWDNRLNWDTDDLPGTLDGDSVNLAGNWVNYGGTTRIDDLDFGSGGALSITHGKLTVEGDVISGDAGGRVDIDNAGQFWMNGTTADSNITLNIEGGRLANTGHVEGTTDTTITGGDAILASDNATFDVTADSSLSIIGSNADVGFDGDQGGTAVLRFEESSVLSFEADETGVSGISEFRSGAFGDSPDVQSGVNVEKSILRIDVSNLDQSEETEDSLIEADALVGAFSEIHITGLEDGQKAEIVVDYDTDDVMLNIVPTVGDEPIASLTTIGTAAGDLTGTTLWDALTQGQDPLSDDDFTRIYVDEVEIEANIF
jgi:hypothetical protein